MSVLAQAIDLALIGAAVKSAVSAASTRRTPRPNPLSAPTIPRALAVELAAAGQWDALIEAGWLTRVGRPVPDPGNPGQLLRLADDPHALTARAPVRLLLAVNATPDPSPANPSGARRAVAVPVPPEVTDPVAAAAWTYDDPDHPVPCTAAVYAGLTRRT